MIIYIHIFLIMWDAPVLSDMCAQHEVWCWLTIELSHAWTLAMSHSLPQHKQWKKNRQSIIIYYMTNTQITHVFTVVITKRCVPACVCQLIVTCIVYFICYVFLCQWSNSWKFAKCIYKQFEFMIKCRMLNQK